MEGVPRLSSVGNVLMCVLPNYSYGKEVGMCQGSCFLLASGRM